MKRIIAFTLTLIVLFTLAACGGAAGGNTVTIYLPDKAEVYQPDGTLYASVTYTYEGGWQDKESFEVSMKSSAEQMGSATLVHSEKKTVQEISDISKQEIYYNDKGFVVKQVNAYAAGKSEVVYTYDSQNRVITEEVKIYEDGIAEPTVTTQNYTYIDTETGSTSTYTVDSLTYVKTFDKNGRQLSQTLEANGKVMSRTEITYDSVGNVLSQISYSGEQKNMEMKYFYKTVKVSAELAARLPQFKQAK